MGPLPPLRPTASRLKTSCDTTPPRRLLASTFRGSARCVFPASQETLDFVTLLFCGRLRLSVSYIAFSFVFPLQHLAEGLLHSILSELKLQKASVERSYIHALCRVYVGVCRQLGDLERARLFCYSLLKEGTSRAQLPLRLCGGCGAGAGEPSCGRLACVALVPLTALASGFAARLSVAVCPSKARRCVRSPAGAQGLSRPAVPWR